MRPAMAPIQKDGANCHRDGAGTVIAALPASWGSGPDQSDTHRGSRVPREVNVRRLPEALSQSILPRFGGAVPAARSICERVFSQSAVCGYGTLPLSTKFPMFEFSITNICLIEVRMPRSVS
jgi:hypothetical protein